MSLKGKDLNRKITKIGRSYGVTIPLEMLKEYGIEPGDTVKLSGSKTGIEIHKSRTVELPEGISSDFFDVLQRNADEHEKTIKGLIDR